MVYAIERGILANCNMQAMQPLYQQRAIWDIWQWKFDQWMHSFNQDKNWFNQTELYVRFNHKPSNVHCIGRYEEGSQFWQRIQGSCQESRKQRTKPTN